MLTLELGEYPVIIFYTLPAIVVWNSLHLTCVIFGEYLRLAEVLVGKTGVPSVKTTVKGVFPLKVRRGSPYWYQPESMAYPLINKRKNG